MISSGTDVGSASERESETLIRESGVDHLVWNGNIKRERPMTFVVLDKVER